MTQRPRESRHFDAEAPADGAIAYYERCLARFADVRKHALLVLPIVAAFLLLVAMPTTALAATWDGCSIPLERATADTVTTIPCSTEADGHELPTAALEYLPACWRAARERLIGGCDVVVSPLRFDDAPGPMWAGNYSHLVVLRSLLGLARCQLVVASTHGKSCRVYFRLFRSAAL